MAYTQNWDSKGNIYYTDENGQVVNFKVNPFTQLANKAKATAYNVGSWINETNPNSEAYKQKVGAILGLATAPFGLGATLTGGIAKGLTPVVGRKIAQNMAQGIGSGVVGGAIGGGAEAGLNNKNIAVGGLQGATVGGLLGGLGGYGLGKVAQKFERAKLPNNTVAQEQYFNDYVADLNNKTKAMADFRAGKLGMKNGKMQLAYDLADDSPNIPKFVYNPEIEDIARKYFGTTTNRREAGYILNDGTMLDFSGKNFGGTAGRRSLDHREVVDAFLDNPENVNNLEIGFDEFIDNGAIRYMPENQGFFLSRMPSEEQIARMKDLLQYDRGKSSFELVPNVSDWGLNNNFRKDYALWSDPNKIIDDVRTYFRGGKISDFKDYL